MPPPVNLTIHTACRWALPQSRRNQTSARRRGGAVIRDSRAGTTSPRAVGSMTYSAAQPLRLLSSVGFSGISVAVHRLTRIFLGEPSTRLTPQQIRELVGLDDVETRIVIDALKDAGFLIETADGLVGCRSVTAA